MSYATGVRILESGEEFEGSRQYHIRFTRILKEEFSRDLQAHGQKGFTPGVDLVHKAVQVGDAETLRFLLSELLPHVEGGRLSDTYNWQGAVL